MTTTAMNNEMRVKTSVKNNTTLIVGLKEFGFNVQVGPWKCDACHDELMNAAQSVGYTGDTPPWGNPLCALKFKKGKRTIAACKCGWRKNITAKSTYVEKPKCKMQNCPNIVGKKDKGGICQPCRAKIAINHTTQHANTVNKNVVSTKTCNRLNCNNPVPAGRKAVCYECQPPATKFAM